MLNNNENNQENWFNNPTARILLSFYCSYFFIDAIVVIYAISLLIGDMISHLSCKSWNTLPLHSLDVLIVYLSFIVIILQNTHFQLGIHFWLHGKYQYW